MAGSVGPESPERGAHPVEGLAPPASAAEEEEGEGTGEVVVRVIAIDPERRHINLALVPTAPGVTHPTGAAAPPVARSETSPSRPPPLSPFGGPPPQAEPAPPRPAPVQPSVQAQHSPQQ